MTRALDVVEQAWADFHAGRITRDEAVTAARSVLDLTEAGAADLVTHSISPTVRYADDTGGRLILAAHRRRSVRHDVALLALGFVIGCVIIVLLDLAGLS